MKISTVKTVVALCLFILLQSSIELLAQPATKDHNTRRDPMVMVPGYKAPDDDATQATVITIGDYDNFKLGVDFAECSVTSNPRNPLEMYAVWNTTGAAGGKGYRTVNGYDWTAANPSWTGMAGDVVVVSDSTGRLIYENMYGSISGCKVATSSNFGSTWDPVAIAIAGVDKNWIAADQTGGTYSNYIYTVMTASSGGNHARSIDNGATFTNTQVMSTQAIPGMMVAVGPKANLQGGATYVVTNSGSSYASTFTFYESNNGGQSYVQKSSQQFANYVGSYVGGRNSVQNMRTRPYPFISVDNSYGPHRGRLYLVYTSNFPAGDNHKPDIFCRYSDDGGTTWSVAKTVNDDANTVNNHNWFPAVWNDLKTGRLFISWMDTRDCPTSDSAMIYASYTDDGLTFAPNQKVSNKKMKINCTSCGGGGTPAYYGDYNGVTSNGLTSIMAWTDFRENNFGSYVGYFPDYGLRAMPAIDTLAPSATFYASVPSVKLFTDTVFVTASVSGAAMGTFTITYPEGNKLWNFPGQIPIQISSTTAAVGDYILNITTTGSNGTPVHKRTATVRVIPSVAPVANFTANNTNPCESQPVNFTDLSSGPATSWAWSFPGGTPATSAVQNPTGIVYSTAGLYSVSLTVTNQIGTNSLTMNDYINVHPSPVSPVATNQSVCFGQAVPDLTATGVGLQWYYGGVLVGSGSTFATGQTAAGIYNYNVTQTQNGCESLPTIVTLTIHALPAVHLSVLDSVCVSTPAFNLTGGTPVGGTYAGSGVSNGLSFNPAVAGAGNHPITYSYTDIFGCSNSTSQPITVNSLPVVTMDAVNPLCLTAAPVVLTAHPSGGIFSGPGVSGDTLYQAIAGAGEVNISYTYTSPATHCAATANQVVTVTATPEPLAVNKSVCFGQAVPDLTATGTSLQWYSNGVVVGTGSNYVTGKTAAGVYSYAVTQTLNVCESTHLPVSLAINELPVVSFGALDTVCSIQTPFDLTGGLPAGGIYSGAGISNGLTFNPAVAGVGNHPITYTYTDGNTCANSTAQTINVHLFPTVTINTVNTLCINTTPFKLTATPAGGVFSGNGVSGDTLYPSVAGLGSVVITYTYTEPVVKCQQAVTQSLTVHSLPVVSINDSTVCGNRKLYYDATISNPKSYLWSPGGATTAILQIDTVGKGLGARTYSVKVTDANGCITTDNALVTFYDCTGINELSDSKLLELYPNPSTGQFSIRSQSITSGSYDLTIFDALGKLVHSEMGLSVAKEFQHSLNITNLSNGIYVLHLKNKANGYSKRFIINK